VSRISLLLVCVLAALAQPPEQVVMSGSADLRSGGVLDFRSVLRPPGISMKGLGAGGILSDSKRNIVHRYMIDRDTKSYFGYDVLIGPDSGAGDFLVTFQPLTGTEGQKDLAGLKPAPPPRFPAPQSMRDGEAIELDLMVSPDGMKRLTDVIAIESGLAKPVPANTVAPRDYSIDDGPITFDLSRYSLWRQGKNVNNGFTGKPGYTIWLTVPSEARYTLSLVPHEGFRREGVVRDNVIAFEDSGHKYELRLRSPVAGAGKAWNLYVMRAAEKPAGIPGLVQFGTDRLENLLPR
jgi:hypothetical protein